MMRRPAASLKLKEACCSSSKWELKRGPWTPEEDELLTDYIKREGEGRWRTLPKKAGLLRCGKSCRLRWMNYLRPNVKRGHISPDEEDLILRLHRLLGNRWSLIAGRIPGRTDNEIKNYWNTHLSKKLISQGIDPKTHKPFIKYPNPIPSPDDDIDQKLDSETLLDDSQIMEIPNYVPSAVQLGSGLSTVDDEDAAGSKKDLISNCDEGTSNEDGHDDTMDCCPGDAFDAFFNSLINDDMFNCQHQDQEQQHQHSSSSSLNI